MNESLLRMVVGSVDEIPIKPWQRLACLLYSSGTTLENIAQEIRQDFAAVSEFVTSPRGITLLKALVTENTERMDTLIEATTLDSILMMVRIRDLGKTESVKLAAASQLLDRFMPKAKAIDKRHGRNQTGFTDTEKEIERLRRELKESVD